MEPSWPDTMIFGRPVLPPDVGALNAGAMRSGRIGSSLASASGSIGRDHERRLHERHDLVALAFGQPRGDRLWRGPELPRRDARLVERDAVGQADRDEVALADTEPCERVCEPIRRG